MFPCLLQAATASTLRETPLDTLFAIRRSQRLGMHGGEVGMKLASFCVALLAVTFLVHLVWWRIQIPRRQLPTLLLVFFGALPLSAAVGFVVPGLARSMPTTIGEWLHVAVVYLPVSLAYVATYSAVEEDSPSLRIVQYVADAGAVGRSRDDLSTILNDDILLRSRFGAMVRDGLVVDSGGLYALTNRGRRLGSFFTMSFRLLGIRAAG